MYDDDDDASWNGGSGVEKSQNLNTSVEKSRPEVFGGLEDHHINLNPPPPHGGRVIHTDGKEKTFPDAA